MTLAVRTIISKGPQFPRDRYIKGTSSSKRQLDEISNETSNKVPSNEASNNVPDKISDTKGIATSKT